MEMADYRQIHVRIWDDPWFVDLTPGARLAFIWLISNDKASVSGIYEFSVGRCARETGLSRKQVSDAIDSFILSGKVMIEENYIWVKKLRKYNDSGSPNAYKRIMTDLELLPDGLMKESYLSYYPRIEKPEANPEPLDNECEAPCQPLRSPLPTPTKNKEQGIKNKEHRTKNKEQLIDVRVHHPAIIALREATKKYPPKIIWDLVIAKLGECPDTQKLTAVYAEWCARGYNPQNYDGAMDWYKTGIPLKTTNIKTNKNHETTKNILMGNMRDAEARANGN